ncbi:MAG TPA: sigma-54 dependent transcriptional regulator [Polyangia bacterium]|nr:sigma-54 dependent transcriptional regulator [Polyangia bacterium]
MLKVLIIDDQPAVRTALETLFEVHGLPAVSVGSPEEGLHLLATEDIGAVVQDMNFTQENTDGAEGAKLFRTIRELDPEMPVLLMTAWTALETAVSLTKEGAADYIAKPWDDDKLVRTVRNLVNLRALRQENTRLRAQGNRARRSLADKHDLREVIYASPQMHEVVRLAVSIAPSDVPVLITGPNGSGKEKLAEIIQANSRRKDKPFVRVNVGALPENLFEAELFGAEAGAFTGATKLRVGRFEAADGGTLFLDELGTLPLVAQAKLLRVLQTGEFERLGSSSTRKANVRLISATNLDLPRAIAAGQFREDLFFRLNVIELYVPPLADRPDDILPLAEHFLARHVAKENRAPMKFGEEAVTALVNHEFSGNVRELQNRIQRAVLVQQSDTITVADLGLAARPEPGRRPTPAGPLATLASVAAATGGAPPRAPAENDPASAEERAGIEDALLRAGGVVAKAAAEMGLSRQALYRRMERLGIVMERRPR